MKFFRTYAARCSSVAVAAVLAIAALPAVSLAQTSVKLTGADSRTCTYNGTISVDPTGAMTFNVSNCTTSGGPTAVPVCTISGPTNVSSGGSATLTANCTQSPTSWTWTSNAPGFTNPNTATVSGALPDGVYTFQVAGSNSIGTGAASAQFTVTFAPPTSAPVCTLTGSSVTTGQAGTLTANCTPTATSYTWAVVTAGAPALTSATTTTNTNTTVAINTAGQYIYSVTGSNGVGTPVAAQGTITASAPSSGCPATPSNAVGPIAGYTDLGNLRFDLKAGNNTFGQIGYRVLDWPNGATNNMRLSLQKGTSTESPLGEVIQVSIAPCPGQFVETTNPGCNAYKTSGYLNIGNNTTCTLTPGRYYINVRNSSPTGVNTCGAPTNSPSFGYCTSYVKATNY